MAEAWNKGFIMKLQKILIAKMNLVFVTRAIMVNFSEFSKISAG